MTHRSEKCPELPAPPGRIFLFAVVALVAGVSLARWVDQPRGPQCAGVLCVRTTFVTSDSEGTLADVLVSEGEAVSIGDPLVTIIDDQLEQAILSKRRTITALESELQRSLAAAELELKWRTRSLDEEICDIQLRAATFLKEKFDYELRHNMLSDLLSGQDLVMVDGADSLYESLISEQRLSQPDRLSTVLNMEAAANAAEVSAAQVEICEMRQQRLEQLKKELPSQVRRTAGVDVAEANLQQAHEELKQLEAQQQDLTIHSPAIGKVGLYKVRRGDRLTPGTPIVELLDDSQRYLVVSVPSQLITRFDIGNTVHLTFPGNNDREGTVVSVAPQAQPASPKSDGQADSTVQIQVEQKGQLWPQVPIGSQVIVRP